MATPRSRWPGRHAAPTQRLERALLPECSAEEYVLEAIAALPDLDLLADMVERATQRAFMDGAEVGRCEVEEELKDRDARPVRRSQRAS